MQFPNFFLKKAGGTIYVLLLVWAFGSGFERLCRGSLESKQQLLLKMYLLLVGKHITTAALRGNGRGRNSNRTIQVTPLGFFKNKYKRLFLLLFAPQCLLHTHGQTPETTTNKFSLNNFYQKIFKRLCEKLIPYFFMSIKLDKFLKI